MSFRQPYSAADEEASSELLSAAELDSEVFELLAALDEEVEEPVVAVFAGDDD